MRTYPIVGLVALTVGCQGGAPLEEPGTEDSTGVEAVGQVEQKAQFADDTFINVVDPGFAPSLTITADFNPVTVDIIYVSSKTTNSGSTAGTATIVQTLSLGADETKQHMINMFHPAMAGGYGCIVLDSTGETSLDVFQTYVRYGGSMFSAGGSVFTGGSYRIPYTSDQFRMVLAITNQADFPFDIELSNLGGSNFKTINVPAGSTYKFDTQAEHWSLTGTNSVQIFTTNGGVIALSGYLDGWLGRTRITPVKAAPYF